MNSRETSRSDEGGSHFTIVMKDVKIKSENRITEHNRKRSLDMERWADLDPSNKKEDIKNAEVGMFVSR